MSDANKTRTLTADPNRTLLGAGPGGFDPNKTMLGTAPTLNVTQTIKPVQCPICKAFNPAGVMFCVDCGLIFERSLPEDAFGAPAIQLPLLIDTGGREYPIRPGTNVIGREGDISLVDGRVSRRHASIASSDAGVTIEDLGSTNGTKVDGTALTPGQKVALVGGARVSFGGLEVTFSLPGTKGGNTTQVFSANKTAAISGPPKKEAPAAQLIGDTGTYPLKVGMNTFGRRDGNDVKISDPYVSGSHGIIEIGHDGVYLTDTGSSNGTVISDAKLVPNMRTKVAPDDVIRLGSMEFKVVLAEAS